MRVMLGWGTGQAGKPGFPPQRTSTSVFSTCLWNPLPQHWTLPPAGIPHHTLQCPGTLPTCRNSPPQHPSTPLTCRNFPLTAYQHTPHLQEFPIDSIPAHRSPARSAARSWSWWKPASRPGWWPPAPSSSRCWNLAQSVALVLWTWHKGFSTVVFQYACSGYFSTHTVNMTQTVVFPYTHCEYDTNSGISVHTLWTWHKLVFPYTHCEHDTNWYFSTHTVKHDTNSGIPVHPRCGHDAN